MLERNCFSCLLYHVDSDPVKSGCDRFVGMSEHEIKEYLRSHAAEEIKCDSTNNFQHFLNKQ
jgi:hypothetical protein